MGVISALGDNVPANHDALRAGRTGISSLEFLDSKYASVMPFGEVKLTTEALKAKLSVTDTGATRTDLLALHAFEEAIRDAGITQEQLAEAGTALIGASTVGGMCLTDELYQDANSSAEGSQYLASYDCAAPTMFLTKKFSIGGITNTINTACSSSANSIMYGCRLMKQGRASRAIVGGTDSLAKFTINGFNSLMILSSEACRPFDAARRGLNLGEGAAFLVLETEEAAKGKKIYAEVTGYANSNDAFHPSSLSDDGDGPFLSIRGALASAQLHPDEIGFVNAHGTGTENNDLVESRAMKTIFPLMPAFLSTKSYTGHTLGAAGAIEAVFSILSLDNDELFPAVNFNTAIPDTELIPVQAYERKELKHVLSNSFGFGGNCTSLIFSKLR